MRIVRCFIYRKPAIGTGHGAPLRSPDGNRGPGYTFSFFICDHPADRLYILSADRKTEQEKKKQE
ncbi:hypothetical protein D9M70_626520 [compost metagenome]